MSGRHTFARIIVRWPNWLGDTLMARGFLSSLRAAGPQVRIAAIAPAPFLALLASDGAFDEAWARDDAALDARARAFRPDAMFVLPPSFSSAWFAMRSGAPVRVGFRGDWRGALLTHAISRPMRGELHLAREYQSLGEPFGLRAVPFAPLRPVASAGDAAAAAVVRGAVVLAPGAAYGPAKRWPAERYVAVGQRARSQGWPVAVCGASEDAELADAIAGAIGDGAVALAGRTSLQGIAAALRDARVVLSNDSGFAHLAAAVGAPTVTVFGSTSSAWTAPLGAARILQHPPVCSPCFQRNCAIGYLCLHAVSIDEAWQAVVESASERGAMTMETR